MKTIQLLAVAIASMFSNMAIASQDCFTETQRDHSIEITISEAFGGPIFVWNSSDSGASVYINGYYRGTIMGNSTNYYYLSSGPHYVVLDYGNGYTEGQWYNIY